MAAVSASLLPMMEKKRVRPEDAVAVVPVGGRSGDDPAAKRAKGIAAAFAPTKASTSGHGIEPASPEFTVKVKMGKQGLGVEVDWADGKTLYIKGLKSAGAVIDHNRENPQEKLQVGHRIVEVNGKSGVIKEMLAECKKGGTLTFKVRRGIFMEASSAGAKKGDLVLPKPGKNEIAVLLEMPVGQRTMLGLEVDWSSGNSLYIKEVQSGLIKDWNRKHSSGTEVAPGDSIMAVNGVTGDTQAMVKQIQASNKRLHLLIRGPPPPPARSKK